MSVNDRQQYTGPLRLAAVLVVVAIIAIVTIVLASPSESKPVARNSIASPVQPATRSQAPYEAVVRSVNRDGQLTESMVPLGMAIKPHFEQHNQRSSVLIEDLTTGDSLHVGETSDYNIKSLMKVPIVMSLYKAHETGKLDMDKIITLSPQHLDSSFGELYKKGAGHKLSLREAATLSLRKSDNTAIRAINDQLFKVMAKEDRAYSVIKLSMRVGKDGETYMSTQAYASILRCLHDACYDSRADSDVILGHLKNSDFHMPERLLPPGTPVAHKIGTADSSGFRDCGIVYGPKRPFIFCIMLTGGDEHAREDIGELVKLAYDHLQR